ncbi:hypothetical protein [Burkholderia sp. BCC0405]|uniref:hypothetical protein n=1 Tax=Burkholderia sp. BCC0405 TaxID=2676298 RepID=UPI0015889D1C|nr:hypothetical protein [Burkholderia sp. BCC0405]
MTNTIEFRRFGRRRWFFCMLEDGDIKLFGSAATAQAWAVTQGSRLCLWRRNDGSNFSSLGFDCRDACLRRLGGEYV